MPTAFKTLSKTLVLTIVLSVFYFSVNAQNYWQQEVNYRINVRLDDKHHELSGFTTIEYINNSPTELTYIYFHLWPNAYKNNQTALAKQKLEDNPTSKLFNDTLSAGYMDSLAFKVDGVSVKCEPDPMHNDICKLVLNKPLPSGGKIVISTPFYVKIPKGGISRLGHMGQSYQISQWYPKPAVFDATGWHPIPYLDQGEFYSEFGSFDVSITLPKNYVVAATGELQTSSEMDWLTQMAENDAKVDTFKVSDVPPSDSIYKTIRYTENHVHDFAWFADKTFHVLKGEATLPNSGSKVTTWSFFPARVGKFWKKSPQYIHDAVVNYSSYLGDYPYKNCTALEGPLGAGGGMEYPGITIVSSGSNDLMLDDVITHEVGHNWLYGILGFNERDFPFLDEGINTYYEMRYIKEKYPSATLDEAIPLPGFISKILEMDKISHQYYYKVMYDMAATYNTDQPFNLKATDYSSFNYGALVYMKSALCYKYLESYLGKAEFDKIMQSFYEAWKFKHPQPDDFKNAFIKNSSKDVSWFFNDVMPTAKKLDYKVKRFRKNQLLVKNAGTLATPFPIAGVAGDSVVYESWQPGFKGKAWINLPDTLTEKLVIDYPHHTPELFRYNNTLKTQGLLKRVEPLKLKWLTTLKEENTSTIQFLPAPGWNSANKFMLGVLLHNGLLLKKPIEYQLMPMYGFYGKKLAGMGKITRNFFPKVANIRILSFSLSGMQFAYDKETDFHKAKLEAKAVFRDRNNHVYPVHTLTSSVTTATSLLALQGMGEDYTTVFNIGYLYQNPYKINLTTLNYNFKANQNFGRTSVNVVYNIKPSYFKSPLKIKLFGAYVLYHKDGDYMSAFNVAGRSGYNDFEYEGLFPGRFDASGLWSNQFMPVEGGFAVPYGAFADKYLISAGCDFKLLSKSIFKLVKVYGNVAQYESSIKSGFLYEAGFKIGQPDLLEIYFPVLFDESQIGYSNYSNLIRFNLNLRMLSIFNIMERIPQF